VVLPGLLYGATRRVITSLTRVSNLFDFNEITRYLFWVDGAAEVE
jgi:hypothetical protein